MRLVSIEVRYMKPATPDKWVACVFFFFCVQNPAAIIQKGLDVISRDAELGRLSVCTLSHYIYTLPVVCHLHILLYAQQDFLLCLLPEHDEVFLAVYEKTAREPDMMQTLWAYRTRITMQDMTAALNNVPDVKHKHPLLHKFLQEVCKVFCHVLQGSGISFKLSFILLDDICTYGDTCIVYIPLTCSTSWL